ncbi:MAG: hypothetical protein M1587_05205 [Thaumarchaeota archaeon]|nr:hypothetical protein [Nitrososphaerota archaeon]
MSDGFCFGYSSTGNSCGNLFSPLTDAFGFRSSSGISDSIIKSGKHVLGFSMVGFQKETDMSAVAEPIYQKYASRVRVRQYVPMIMLQSEFD